ncbi:CFI-box-CTERM domain-containing protein [Streptomyces pseudovenezuelae]|uniref:Uncharacterized protein n=1 Tax=Streptomyces pseudovenezuelae TaxID=67350 RepID=A0ABT6M2V5_9ACTN|nr:CFI-box-CTERM domain-containing protein [Streptomyces pseudovenezuelae]MDH6222867.1 hypothetical protein [Streptomyces pseudovenezuelae]
MSLWIDRTPLEYLAAEDLRRVCPDSAMTIDLINPAQDKNHSGRVRYPAAARTVSSLGCELVAFLVAIPQAVTISALGPDSTAPTNPPVPLRRHHGLTTPKTVPNRLPLPNWTAVIYDPSDDRGRGYWAQDDADASRRNHSKSDEILFHELCHVRDIYSSRFIGMPVADYLRVGEDSAVAQENEYLEGKGRRRRARRGGGTGLRDSDGCFVATAAYGSALAPQLDILRTVRDDVLGATRMGRDFFDEFYGEYFRFSRDLADEMRRDPRLRDLFRVALVTPLISYLRLALRLPRTSLDGVPEPWHGFLTGLQSDLDAWCQDLPRPADFREMTSEQVLEEVSVFLRLLPIGRLERHAWLTELTASRHVPVSLPSTAVKTWQNRLRTEGCTEEEIVLLLAEDSSPPRTDSQALAHVDEEDVPASDVAPERFPYLMTLRNASAMTFDEVVVFHRSRGVAGVTFNGVTGFPPNAVENFYLGQCASMLGYTVGFFSANRMIARIPEAGGEMTPTLAATLDPNRVDACSDAWAIYEANFLPLDQMTYTVVVRNQTADTWDEVALSYVLVGQTVEIAITGVVAPGTQVTIPIGPCDKLVGYNFAIFVDGLAVDFDPRDDTERLMFPLQGSMNSYRSLQEHTVADWQPCTDTWEVGG